MSKGKDAQACKGVLDYLNRQNRPYSAIDIFNNLHKEYGKTAVEKACETLSEEGKISKKIYGKQKVFVAVQSQFPNVDDNEIKEMDQKVVTLNEQVQIRQEEVRKLEGEIKGFNSSISTEEARKLIKELDHENQTLSLKIAKLKEGGNVISPQEKERVYSSRTKYVKEWRKRKRMGNDILGAILEGYPKTKKQLYEEIGVETDEDFNVAIPEI